MKPSPATPRSFPHPPCPASSGGLLASLIDCHGTGTAAVTYRAEGREMGSEPQLRFVTGALNVSYYLKPTPLGPGAGDPRPGEGDQGPQGGRRGDRLC